MPKILVRRLTTGGLLIAATSIMPAGARAAPPQQQLQAARDLFAQAEQDEDTEHWVEALDKLQRVASVKLTAGVRYHIALCEEHTGRLASALADYGAAEDQAVVENAQDVLRLVGIEMAPLIARVPRLAIHVAPEVSAATVTLDGTLVAPEHLGATITVDPGSHRVEARAPGHATTSVVVTMHERDVTFLEVGLRPTAVTPGPTETTGPVGRGLAASRSDPPERSAAAHGHTVPIIATALAVALAGAGIGAYLAADAAHADGVRDCAEVASSSPDACDSLKNSVRVWDWTATGAWAGAVATAAIAAALWARPTREPAPTALGWLVLGPGTVGAAGTF